ncbi:MAG: hypothetical protein IT379_04425 [Deltaproteobacteria bacterium]|nr:hypothetical protein [Deltaproteobacteria bacterium]
MTGDAPVAVSARLGSGMDALVERFDGKMLAMRTARPHAPGERADVAIDASGRTVRVRGKVVRVVREGDAFLVTLSLLSLSRGDREALVSLLAEAGAPRPR